MVTAKSWTDETLELHCIPLKVLGVLKAGNFEDARSLLHPLTLPSEFIVSTGCRSTWTRRYKQLQDEPEDALWITRLVVLRATQEVIGRAGFHGRPDATGMVEIGYEIDPLFRRQGHGMAAMKIMIDTARQDPQVKVVQASVGVTNSVSQRMIVGSAFRKVGEEMDDEDGLEEVYALDIKTEDCGSRGRPV